MSVGRVVKLSSGFDCPVLGYGTFQSNDAEKLKCGLKAAIEVGYRHIDTADGYGNEHVIGETLAELYQANLVKREDLFITTKLSGVYHRPDSVSESLKRQLGKLQTSYVDLYLVHFPVPMRKIDGKSEVDTETKLLDTWKAMEECVKAGLTRSIGVSNFNINQLQRLLQSGSIKPACNQVEVHPGFQNTKLIAFCQSSAVAVTGYAPFGSPGTTSSVTGQLICDVDLLTDERLIKIGEKYGKTPAQVILRWEIQRGLIVIPKSLTPSRIQENFNVWDFQLTAEDMHVIGSMDGNSRFFRMAFPGVTSHPEYPFHELASC